MVASLSGNMLTHDYLTLKHLVYSISADSLIYELHIPQINAKWEDGMFIYLK